MILVDKTSRITKIIWFERLAINKYIYFIAKFDYSL
jgi:hypothetical protein